MLLLSTFALAGAVIISTQTPPPAPPRPLPSVVRIGLDPTIPPFAMMQDGVISGIDAAILTQVMAQMGITARFAAISSDGLYDALITNQVDVIGSGLVVEDRFGGKVRYTRAYFDNGLQLVSRLSAPVVSWRDLPNRSLALELGSGAATQAQRWQRRIEPFTVLPYELPVYALDSLYIGDADAALVDHLTLALYPLHDRVGWQSSSITQTPYAFALRPEDAALYSAINQTLAQMLMDGTIERIIVQNLATSG